MNPQEILLQYFQFKEFRPLQLQIVQSIIGGQDTFALLPTGGGKSICFQVPGLHFFQTGKITLVVSPLIALMKDQVDHLLAKNIPATFLNHSLNEAEVNERISKIEKHEYVFIYISPERLMMPLFQQLCQKLPIALVAIDEAHCISQWGHDFRPEYLQIDQFIAQLPQRPIVAAFTATAPPKTKKEIIQRLHLRQPQIFQSSFARPNLRFQVITCTSTQQQELKLLELVHRHRNQSGIIYCATRANTEYLAKLLRHYHFKCDAYHGGMEPEQRAIIQEKFLANQVRLISSTNAFGMGVDKPDIAFVIHYNFTSTLEAYYQEAGRAGRNGEPADCIVLFQKDDVNPLLYLLKQKFTNQKLTYRQKQQKNLSKEKLITTLKYLQLHTCRSHFLLHYLGEQKLSKKCRQCDCCMIQAKMNQPTSLSLYHRLLQPKTKAEYLQLPGVGEGWLKKHYAFWAVESLSNVLQN